MVLLLCARAIQLREILRGARARPLALTGPAARHNQPPDLQSVLRPIERDQLRHEPAHAESKHVDLREAQRESDVDHVRGPAGVLLGDLAARLADAGVVDQDHETGGRERVDEQRVPVVEGAAEVDVHDQWERGVGAGGGWGERADGQVGELNPVNGDVLDRGVFVGRHFDGCWMNGLRIWLWVLLLVWANLFCASPAK